VLKDNRRTDGRSDGISSRILRYQRLAISMGKTRYFKYRKYHNFWTNKKSYRQIKNALCLRFFHICRKIEFLFL